MNKALSGIRVLDFTQVLAGPFCTMNLADFGAEVIKIEKPGTGDGSRIFGPFINGQSGYYTLVNRGKKGVAIDLKKGRDIIYEMVRNCDIVVENFKPGVMEKLGYSYEQLKKVNPEIIYCSISGFGQDSPMRDLPAYDIVAQGMSGMMSITGYPNTPPARVGSSLGDVSAGLYAVTGILLALYNRERTGQGSMWILRCWTACSPSSRPTWCGTPLAACIPPAWVPAIRSVLRLIFTAVKMPM